MTKVVEKEVTCIKCGKKSKQLMVYSVNYSLGSKEANDRLKEHKQICPHCNYTSPLISVEKESN